MNRPGNPGTKLPEKEVNRMTKKTRFSPESVNGQFVWFWKVRANMTHNGGNLFHCSKDWLYAGDSACLVRQYERDTGGGDGGLTTAELSV